MNRGAPCPLFAAAATGLLRRRGGCRRSGRGEKTDGAFSALLERLASPEPSREGGGWLRLPPGRLGRLA